MEQVCVWKVESVSHRVLIILKDSPGEETEADWVYPSAQGLSSTIKAGLCK